LRERLEIEGLPPLGFHVFMGERIKEAQINGARNAEEGRTSSVEILVRSDYVYCMSFDGDKIRHMTKIWNAGWAMKELGWG
jgi:hypothetical protein